MTGLFKNLSLSRCFPRGRRLGETVRGCLTDRAGIAAVEFGMVLPMFLLFLFGTVEFGRFMWSENALDYAADQTARYALANPSATTSDVKTYAESQFTTIDKADVTVIVADELLNGINYLKVTVTHPYETLLPLVPFGPFTLTRVSRTPK
jgi:Flp pilus assembly protein TadG